MVKIKILGISGSPRKRSNTAILVKTALDVASEVGDVDTEAILLSQVKIEACKADQSCWKAKVPKCLVIEDDMQEIYPKLMDADGIIIGTPVYFGTVTGQLKIFMDRTTCLAGSNKLRNKVGAAIATGAVRHGGQEFAMKTIHNFFLCHGMLVVSILHYGYWGVGGVSTFDPGSIAKDTWMHGEENISTLKIARELGKRVVEAAKIVKAGSKIAGRS